jgi:predicted metal-dependent peptidase
MIAQGIYLPSCYSVSLGPIAIVQDTSASVSKPMKDAFISELNAIATDNPPESIHSMYVDTEVQQVDVIERDDYPITLREVRGRGTKFDPPFKWLVEHDITPTLLIYMTDGEATCTLDDPGYPVLWLCTTGAKDFAKFGTIIKLDL